MIEDLTLLVSEDYFNDQKPCKGHVYRARVSTYIGKRGELVDIRKLIPLKRLSCSGCEICGWIDDDLSKMGVESISNFDEIEDGKRYELIARPTYSLDPEDDYEIQVSEYVEVK